MDYSQIKLIIWDLDDTFWHGTLSESERGGVISDRLAIDLVNRTTDCGIVNAVCSKNDKQPAELKLAEFGVLDLFVFNSIDWTPKGPRISTMIREMGLRPVNVLFIDDNIVNLNEAKHYSPELMIAEPSIIPELMSYFGSLTPKDMKHSRLNNYKILEQKANSKKEFADNLSFLYSTNTKVDIHQDCEKQLERIHELVLRTNQLNYTKNRCTIEELKQLIEDDTVDCGYVTVKDNFGDYGIVGFYALKDKHLIHFLFSCRTIGQGVEQYVYSYLNCPELEVVGKVVNDVVKGPAPEWINQCSNIQDNVGEHKKMGKIVFKGPCDILAMTSYLVTDKIIRELTYVGEKSHITIEHHNHSINYTRFPFLNDDEKQNLLNNFPFNDEGMFDTALYDKDTDIVFLSTLPEHSLGVYKNKSNGYKFAWGEWNRPLTDKNLWEFYVNEDSSYNGNINYEWLSWFSDNYEYEGRLKVKEYLANLNFLLAHMNPKATLCLLLGSETKYDNNKQPAYEDRHLAHKEFNDEIRKFAQDKSQVKLLDFTKYVKSQDDYVGNINHFQRKVYFEMSRDVNQIIAESGGQKIKERGKWMLFFDEFSLRTRKLLNNSKIYPLLRRIYGLVRRDVYTAK